MPANPPLQSSSSPRQTRAYIGSILCTVCNEEHEENMLRCNSCNVRHHFRCVNVDQNDVECIKTWLCDKCQYKMLIPEKEAAFSKNGIGDEVLKENALSTDDIERKLRLLDEEQELVKREREIVQQKLALLKLHKSEAKIEESAMQRQANGTEEIGINAPCNEKSLPTIISSTPNMNEKLHFNSPFNVTEGILNTPQRISPCPAQDGSVQSQWMARKSMSKELPTFTGKSEEWPIFWTAFNTSTSACGFNNIENLIRLQKCLQGRARKLVESQLVFPECVPQIMTTLKRIFGKPEDIIRIQIDSIRKVPPVKIEKLGTLIELSATVNNLCATIKASGLSQYDNNPTLIYELVEKLPNQMRMEWSAYKKSLTVGSTVTAFGQWLETIAENASEIVSVQDLMLNDRSRVTNRVNIHSETDETKHCLVCNGNCKSLVKCKKFINLSATDRWKQIRSLNLCKACFKQYHPKRRCNWIVKCDRTGCERMHHPLLHNENLDPDTSNNDIIVKEQTHCSHITPTQSPQFRYIPVILENGKQKLQVVAMLDEGSSGTYINEECAKILDLEGPKMDLCLKWTGSQHRIENSSMQVSLKVSKIIEASRKYDIKNAQTVRSLDLPQQTLNYEKLCRIYPYMRKLPVQSYKNTRPQILIGLNNWKLGVPLKVREGKDKQPMVCKCRLGWTVFAANERNECHSINICNFHTYEVTSDNELHNLVKHFFNVESLGIQSSQDVVLSKEESRAKKILENTTKYIRDRYETGLLWKYDCVELPNSEMMAQHRLEVLEKRLERKPYLKESMLKQMKEYEQKGYIRKLTNQELERQYERVWYLPVFPIENPNKPGKIRMVWDAAAQVQGVSLNNMLLKGPDQLSSLFGILLRFRERKIGVSGDIKEMFHQVLIRKEDQHAQRFIWRSCETFREPDTFVMQVMSFGATCSPSSAQFVKNKNATKFINENPKAVKLITNDHYVDDLLASFDSKEEAILLTKDVREIHKKGGFEIRNWRSNSAEVLQALDSNNSILPLNINIEYKVNSEKVLGMWWQMNEDTFTYSLRFNKGNQEVLNGERKPTKREVLRILMSIYDPFGLLAYYLNYLKVLLQEIWRSGVDWDQPINDAHDEKWTIWLRLLPSVEKLRIQRCILKQFRNWLEVNTQLHIFVDASKDISAAVAYLRIEKDNIVECALLGAKSKVAPLKLLSIPKLELIAALIGSRYSKSLLKAFSITINKVMYWSDSKTVLSWLQTDPKENKGQQFVAFRVAEIQENSNINNWRYIPTKLNIADTATKWQVLPKFNLNEQWFHGPDFLYKPEAKWPQDNFHQEPVEISETLAVHNNEVAPLIKYERFSKWKRLWRTVAYVFKFLNLISSKSKQKKINKELTPEELKKAETTLIKIAQLERFSKEIRRLKSKYNTVEQSSQIYKLSPYLDEDNILRMKGRIDNMEEVNDDTKRPVILPRDHYITNLLIKSYHEKYKHQNHETVVNEIRQRYWIPQLRQLVKRIRKSCNTCKILTAKPEAPEMGPLPAARLAIYTHPFTYTGVDYFGPMKVMHGRRVEKRWGCLFTCLTVRAVHIEIAHSLDTSNFILCLRNFMQRRGEPREIYCDNGTNFVGAEKELRQEIGKLKQKDILREFTSPQIGFKFNPPAAPHMGGSWERLVKSVKTTLYAIQPNRAPTDPLLRSYLMEVENIINSRPLTYLPLDSEESEALTPNNFLRGTSGGGKPIGCFSDDAKILKNNWLMSQLYAKQFWKRWLTEYLPTLTRRSKWCKPVEPLQEEDLVIVVDNTQPRNTWVRGRVIKINKGRDNQVRSAVVQTSAGLFRRPAVKLAKLDIES